SGEEAKAIAPCAVVGRLAAQTGRTFEWVLANVDERGHIRGRLFARPPPRLVEEYEFHVVDANRAKLWTAKIEQLVALGWALAGEQIHLVVAVEVVLVRAIAELHAL